MWGYNNIMQSVYIIEHLHHDSLSGLLLRTSHLRLDSCERLLDKVVEGIDSPGLGVVLDDGAIGLDDVDGRKGLGVQLGLDKVALLISAELVNVNVGLFGERCELVLHALAELAPGGVDGNDGGFSALDDLSCSLGSGKALDGAVLPEVAVEGLLGSGDVDAALGLGGAVLVGKADEAALAL